MKSVALVHRGVGSVGRLGGTASIAIGRRRRIRSIKHECLRRLIFVGSASLDRALTAYAAHYNGERNHQGISNQLIAPAAPVGGTDGTVVCNDRLGGLLKYDSRRAA